jgi:hypothetical protein
MSKKDFSAAVSQYGNKNRSEKFAECFAMYVNGQPLPEPFMKFFDTYLEPIV